MGVGARIGEDPPGFVSIHLSSPEDPKGSMVEFAPVRAVTAPVGASTAPMNQKIGQEDPHQEHDPVTLANRPDAESHQQHEVEDSATDAPDVLRYPFARYPL